MSNLRFLARRQVAPSLLRANIQDGTRMVHYTLLIRDQQTTTEDVANAKSIQSSRSDFCCFDKIQIYSNLLDMSFEATGQTACRIN